jgi:hypothetical protein
MENKKSLLKLSSVDIPDTKLSIRIPTVGEILDDEFTYYSIISSLTATPYQYMVQLDDMGVDFTTITDYQLFVMLFSIYARSDLSMVFENLNISNFEIRQNGSLQYLYDPDNNLEINEKIYYDIVNIIRKINLLERVNYKPGNESARKYLLEKERKKQKRSAVKKQVPYLEKLVIALVNTSEFPYDYDSCMDLSIYKLHQSFKQIQHKIAFDNTMVGIYAGTVDTSKLSNKDILSWIPSK